MGDGRRVHSDERACGAARSGRPGHRYSHGRRKDGGIFLKAVVDCQPTVAKGLLKGQADTLNSAFHLTYNMVRARVELHGYFDLIHIVNGALMVGTQPSARGGHQPRVHDRAVLLPVPAGVGCACVRSLLNRSDSSDRAKAGKAHGRESRHRNSRRRGVCLCVLMLRIAAHLSRHASTTTSAINSLCSPKTCRHVCVAVLTARRSSHSPSTASPSSTSGALCTLWRASWTLVGARLSIFKRNRSLKMQRYAN